MSKSEEALALNRQDAADAASNNANLIAPIGRIQAIIAKRMTWSKQNIPCFYLQRQADIGSLLDMRRGTGGKDKVKVTTNDFLMKAMGQAVVRFPLMAGRREGDEIVIASTITVGFAVAAPHGLVVPVIRDIHKKSITQVAAESDMLTRKARSNQLVADDVGGACITLSNLGAFGIDSFIAVVPPHHASVLAVGNTAKTPVRIDGKITVRRTLVLTLSVDHTIVNGDYAACFLNFLCELLEQPQRLL